MAVDVAEYVGLVRAVRQRYYPGSAGWLDDDLLSAGLLGLLRASRSFDQGRGSTFENYDWRRIHGAMQDYFREEACSRRSAVDRYGNAIALTMPAPTDPAEIVDLAGQAAVGDLDLALTVQQALAVLPERDRGIVREVFFGDRSQAEVARRLGITDVRVGQITARARERMREFLGSNPMVT
jgi:RNA polymerase sigma factor (sigma-70 family)